MTIFAADTHQGNVYQHNEDCVGWDVDKQLWLVADGMGGHACGEIASGLAKKTILDNVQQEAELQTSVENAHLAIVEAANKNSALHKMGSTVVALQLHGDRCNVVWVGDSRAYLWRKNKIEQISRDHSFLEMLLDEDLISEKEARAHPNRNLVVRALGQDVATPDAAIITARKNDWYLLCSDGLSDELTDEAISKTLRLAGTPKQAVEDLMAQVLENGAQDNVSIIVVANTNSPDGGTNTSSLRLSIVVVTLILVAVLGAMITWLL